MSAYNNVIIELRGYWNDEELERHDAYAKQTMGPMSPEKAKDWFRTNGFHQVRLGIFVRLGGILHRHDDGKPNVTPKLGIFVGEVEWLRSTDGVTVTDE